MTQNKRAQIGLLMNVTIFPAHNGDSFLIETKGGTVVLIDGGYVSTYKEYIKPKLLELSKANKNLSHLIVTHIDSDHISGVIKFIEENKQNEIIKVEDIWHNSYSQLKSIEDGLNFKGKTIDNLPINYLLKDGVDDIKNKNISAVQGSTLASLIKKFGYRINAHFSKNIVSVDTKEHILSNDIAFKILSPNHEKLLELKKYWKRELYKKGYSSDENLTDFNEEVFEYILSLEKEKKRLMSKNVTAKSSMDIDNLSNEVFVEDETTTNGSSIAFVLEYKNLRILFLGDAHPSVIVNSLKKYYTPDKFPVKFDLIKIAHHGSKNNTSPELLNYIDSENYVISTNGLSHNHPDPETIARIINRKVEFTRKLYFNYSLDSNVSFKDKVLMEKYNYQIIESSNNQPLELSLSYE
ncbi:AVAST type 1 anti-phage system MBL fold metallo-hydrolase Avs1a [Elizabethkingia sp. JS20170427COW]|uniref:AVAST type 1 anti-phage system MBL fold metallo-hydrolase Avs1a n=1 Tax=Elizabethkingia sp. JS20170427COW TaxID=2583851 RepID=UPI00111024F8|nr:AVAST type 1 anti-phage system MBL fold metallo-hydrolase Avs1a [Elizabethkingia sp. JS20170427COW]QCX53634.1 MBL fold metallo-hydrolase [Elizabethkingia sp. JS20170427COW]